MTRRAIEALKESEREGWKRANCIFQDPRAAARERRDGKTSRRRQEANLGRRIGERQVGHENETNGSLRRCRRRRRGGDSRRVARDRSLRIFRGNATGRILSLDICRREEVLPSRFRFRRTRSRPTRRRHFLLSSVRSLEKLGPTAVLQQRRVSETRSASVATRENRRTRFALILLLLFPPRVASRAKREERTISPRVYREKPPSLRCRFYLLYYFSLRLHVRETSFDTAQTMHRE